jgi:arabinan endo-1,5-alpha-L-arabinosidase
VIEQISPWLHIYDPGIGEKEPWYINDHSFYYGPDPKWHLTGITHQEPRNPHYEVLFAHATADSLTQVPWEKQAPLLQAETQADERLLWAPHVLCYQGLYYMYYCAGGGAVAHDPTDFRIHLATSADGWQWQRSPANPLFTDGFEARDPMVLREQDTWLLYYAATATPTGGHFQVAYRESADLIHWGPKQVAYTDELSGTDGGPCESPFVVRRGRYYYLFLGPRGSYDGTDIFRSIAPYQWQASDWVGHIESHAAEVIRDVDGKWYVSRCGWGRGGVYLAEIRFPDGQDDAPTSLPPPSLSPQE